MISHGRNTFQCKVMHANQGPGKAFSSKSHVQTARESHDLIMDFAVQTASRNEFPCKNAYSYAGQFTAYMCQTRLFYVSLRKRFASTLGYF